MKIASGASAPASGVAARRAFDLERLFAPRSIAVVGASMRSGIATTVRDNIALIGGSQACYFVNPKYDVVDGTPCYPSLEALPEVPDTVVLAVNPLRAARFTREAADAGVSTVVIPGGGVVEGGEEAAAMQAEVRRIAIETGTAILGPNCMGMVDLATNSAAYIGDINPWLRRGGVAGIAQSGSVSDAFLHAGTRIGWSRIVSCGSEVVLDVCDYLAYCLDDAETHAVILFVEGFKRPERFLALADRALEMGKTIMAVKVGRSSQAQAAAIAHSGSLAGEDRVTDAALRAAGVIRCADLDELLETAELAAGTRRMGRSVGRGRTGVVTVSTGEGSLIADLAPRTGIDLPPVPDATRARIHADLSTLGYIGNPMDPWGADETGHAYGSCLRAFADSGAYDVLAVVHDFPFRSQRGEVQLATELAVELGGATADRPGVLPVFVSLTSGDATPEIQEALDTAGGIPLLRGTIEAFSAIARLAWWEGRRGERRLSGPWRAEWAALANDRTPYGDDDPRLPASAALEAHPERESLEMLRAAGVPVTSVIAAADADAASVAATGLGWPVVLKLDAIGVAHKSDIGGVALGLRDEAAVRSAFEQVTAAGRHAGATVRGVLVEPMAGTGVELVVGFRRDPTFGPTVLVGSGGILAEILDDVAIRLVPLDRAVAREMLMELRSAPILAGARGRTQVDQDALADLIVALARFGADRPDIAEIDLNPVIASANGAIAVDALIVTTETPGA
ncbi:MAG TPA: acetate--CoA ligase family protein [Candidatus Acidoferrum sp.]|nr:acetate--CoA ligase family protein [Candidatus Acidoferrum sp.]